MIMVLPVEISRNNVSSSLNFSKKTPVKVGEFLDNSNAMYISLLKENLELIQKENEKIEATFHDILVHAF